MHKLNVAEKKTRIFSFITLQPGKILLLLIAVLYMFTLKGLPGNLHPNGTGTQKIVMNRPPFETSMERGRYAQTVSLAESGDFTVNEFYKFLKPDIAWYNNNFYSTFPPGVAVLSVPFYLVGKTFGLAQVFTSLATLTFSLLTAYLIYLVCRKLMLSIKASLFSTLVFSFASVVWPYSVSLSAHPVSAFMLILCLYIMLGLDYRRNDAIRYSLAGLLFGLSLFIDYPNLIIFLPVMLIFFFKGIVKGLDVTKGANLKFTAPKELYLLVFCFLVVLGGFVIFNMKHYSTPIAFTNAYSIKFIETSGQDFENITLTNNLFSDRNYANRFSLKTTLNGVFTLLLSHDRGLFYFFPIFILALIGIIHLHKENKLVSVLISVTFIINVLFYASYDDAWGGWAFGPRYLIISLPLVAILCGFAYQNLVKKFGSYAKAIIFALLLFSTGVALIGALTTNAVPPSIEVASTGGKDNFVLNLDYLQNNGVSSFMYLVVFSQVLDPQIYAFLLLLLVGIIEFFVVFSRDAIFDQATPPI